MKDDESRDEEPHRATARFKAARLVGNWHLVTIGSGGTKTFRLPQDGEVLIGRADDCAVRIDHESVSRQHAKLVIGESITLVDLGSANGTMVGDKSAPPGEAVRVAPGLVLTFGRVNAVIQSAPSNASLRPLRSHDYFEARLEDECTRAEAAGTGLALVRIRVKDKDERALELVLSRVLRAQDVIALCVPHEYEVLLLEVDADTANALSDQLRRALADGGVRATSSMALFPRDARTPAGLVSITRDAVTGDSEPPPPPIVPTLSVLESMRPIVERIAASDISVLIVGETGVGKELLSRMVHEVSPRRDRPLLLINCATLQETLLESELFGHERGAFTGAVQTKRGILEAAEGGTLILDEIGEMPLSVQAKLLRVFEHQEVVRVGAVKPTPIDVRFVAATNRDLEREIERGTFRQDLYFRLNGITLVVPPLRERVGEIDQLAEGMVAQAARRMGREVPSISAEVKKLLKRYAWPGNLRELRNVLERAVVLCAGDVITLAHLPVDRMGRVLESGARPSPMPPSFPETPFPMRAGTQADPPPSGAGTGAPRLVRGFDGSDEERQKLVDALARCGGNQSLAAKMLGVSRRTLVTRIEQYGLPRPRKVPPPA